VRVSSFISHSFYKLISNQKMTLLNLILPHRSVAEICSVSSKDGMNH
jgi:hypothetical protein